MHKRHPFGGMPQDDAVACEVRQPAATSVENFCDVFCFVPDICCCVVAQVDSGTWSVPDLLPGPSPGARAFHCAVALGQRLLLFGGHILTFDAEHNRKRRTFFNDVWQLDTVRA
jgi:hypothetical protein